MRALHLGEAGLRACPSSDDRTPGALPSALLPANGDAGQVSADDVVINPPGGEYCPCLSAKYISTSQQAWRGTPAGPPEAAPGASKG